MSCHSPFIVCPGQWKSLVDIFQHCPVFLISSLLWFLCLHWFSKWPYYWNKPFWRYGERKMEKVALREINGINLTLIILFLKLWSLPLEQWTLKNNNALLFYYVYCTRCSNLSNVCSNIFFTLRLYRFCPIDFNCGVEKIIRMSTLILTVIWL